MFTPRSPENQALLTALNYPGVCRSKLTPPIGPSVAHSTFLAVVLIKKDLTNTASLNEVLWSCSIVSNLQNKSPKPLTFVASRISGDFP